MQTTYDDGQKFKTLHRQNNGLVTVYHGSKDQAIEFSGKFADSYICMHQKLGSDWSEILKDQRCYPRGKDFKWIELN